MTNTDTPSQGIGLSEAASQFESLLAGKSDNQTREQDAPETSAEEAEAHEASPDDAETPDDADETAEAGAEDEEADTGAEEAPPLADPKQLVTVTVDGKQEQVTVEEAARGYQRSKVFSQKTEQMAREREALTAERHEVIQERQQYATLLTALQQQLEGQMQQEPDWDKLYAEDPLEYVRQTKVWNDRKEQLQATRAEQQRLAHQQEQEAKRQLDEVIREGRKTLLEKFPAWNNPEKFEADRQRIRKYATEQAGYNDEEVKRTYDPRAVSLLYKAMRYDEMMAKRPQPVPQAGPKPMRAGSPLTAPRRTTEVTKAKQRLAKTGSVKDAAKLFEGLI